MTREAINRLRVLLAAVGCMASIPVLAQSQADDLAALNYPYLVDFSADAKLGAISEGDRTLGLTPGKDTSSDEFSLDIKPEWVWQLSPHWRSKLRLQAFGATGKVDVSDEIGGSGTTTDGFFALREVWLDYNGLSSYPGESIRFGRERIKEDTGLWWDDDLALVRWIFNTTLLDTTVGFANKLSEARTDISELNKDEQDIARVFASTRWQWRKDHYLSFLVTHAERYGDENDLARHPEDGLPDRVVKSLTWVGIRADQAYFDWHSRSPVQYLASVGAVAGEDTRITGNPSAPGGFTSEERDVAGWAADLGLRAQLADSPRWVVGMQGAVASGGDEKGKSDAFRQTQMESNRSRFTGTRSLISRFGEAFQPEWSNIKVATVYTALSDRDTWDANLLYHRYWISDAGGTIYSDLVDPEFVGTSKDLGESVDLVLGYYGNQSVSNWTSFDARLRAGVFLFGDAYGDSADSARHRVILDITKRF